MRHPIAYQGLTVGVVGTKPDPMASVYVAFDVAFDAFGKGLELHGGLRGLKELRV
jgi:hypothetical protein